MDRHQHLSALAATDGPLPPRAPLAAGATAGHGRARALESAPSLAQNVEAPEAPVAQAAPAWVALANLGLTVFCAAAVVVTLALAVGPRFFAYETFIVRSGSMEPAIHTGSLVVVQPVQPRQVAVGDVITYRRPEDPDTTITHRVVEVRAPGAPGGASPAGGQAPVFRTKGDANAVVDPWEVQLQGIAWRVTLNVPLAGYLFAFTQQPLGRALFLIVPGLGLGALWLHRTWLGLRRPTGGGAAGAAAGGPRADGER
jgi:signal peptidase I